MQNFKPIFLFYSFIEQILSGHLASWILWEAPAKCLEGVRSPRFLLMDVGEEDEGNEAEVGMGTLQPGMQVRAW